MRTWTGINQISSLGGSGSGSGGGGGGSSSEGEEMACKRFKINSCSVRSCCFSISDVVVVVASKDAAGDSGWFVAGVTEG